MPSLFSLLRIKSLKQLKGVPTVADWWLGEKEKNKQTNRLQDRRFNWVLQKPFNQPNVLGCCPWQNTLCNSTKLISAYNLGKWSMCYLPPQCVGAALVSFAAIHNQTSPIKWGWNLLEQKWTSQQNTGSMWHVQSQNRLLNVSLWRSHWRSSWTRSFWDNWCSISLVSSLASRSSHPSFCTPGSHVIKLFEKS